MAQTGQRTTANARPTTASSTASSSSSSKKSSSSSSKSSSKKGRTYELSTGHPFDPGDEVTVTSIDGQTTKTVKVSAKGEVKISGLKNGLYTATADPRERDNDLVDENAPAQQNLTPQEDRTVEFTVKDEEAARKAKYEKYGGAQPLAQQSARSQR